MKTLLLFLLLLFALPALAQLPQQGTSAYPFTHPQQYKQFEHIISTLRCLVCQNQSLADSNAKLAVDLRNQVYKMINQGQSTEAIQTYMVARYGDFILLKPPVNKLTFALWFGPFILLFLALLGTIVIIKKRQNRREVELSADDKAKVKTLLGQPL